MVVRIDLKTEKPTVLEPMTEKDMERLRKVIYDLYLITEENKEN
jgi:hypothetical protein